MGNKHTNKQWQKWTWRHTAVCSTSLRCAETCLFVIYCNAFLGGLWLFMSPQPKNEVINCTSVTLQLKLEARTRTDHRCSGWRVRFSKRSHGGDARSHHTKNKSGRAGTTTGSAAKPHATWQYHFHRRAQTHASTQAHSTFNDPILSAKWRYSQLHALNWHL